MGEIVTGCPLSELCPVTRTSNEDGRHQRSLHSFNISPYLENVLKIVLQTIEPIFKKHCMAVIWVIDFQNCIW